MRTVCLVPGETSTYIFFKRNPFNTAFALAVSVLTGFDGNCNCCCCGFYFVLLLDWRNQGKDRPRVLEIEFSFLGGSLFAVSRLNWNGFVSRYSSALHRVEWKVILWLLSACGWRTASPELYIPVFTKMTLMLWFDWLPSIMPFAPFWTFGVGPLVRSR